MAASIGLSPDYPAVTIQGDIVAGDAERLIKVFTDVKPYGSLYIFPNAVELATRGGDVAEAIRIAAVVRSLGLSTGVRPDGKGMCASSCFLIYLAGVPRSATGMDTIRREGAKGNLGPVGVHRPYLAQIQDGSSGAQRQEVVMQQISSYLRKENVPQMLIDKMMTRPSNDVYWLSEAELLEFGEYPPGAEEQLIANCRYVRGAHQKMSAAEWIKDSETGVGACIRSYLVDHYRPSSDVVDKMRRGWRPWN